MKSFFICIQKSERNTVPAGYMFKRGGTNRSFKRRYFVLIGDELGYYKNRESYENGKEPCGRIILNNPPAIIKVQKPQPSNYQMSNHIIYWYIIIIHTPKRKYELRIDGYHCMIFWVRKLMRINPDNQLIDGISILIQQSEQLHVQSH